MTAPFAYPAVPHVRRHGPQGYADHESYRPWLRDEFAFRCVYCLTREVWGPFQGVYAQDVLPTDAGMAVLGSPGAVTMPVPGPSRLPFRVDVDQDSAAAVQPPLAPPRAGDLVDQVFTTPVAVRETAAGPDGLPTAVFAELIGKLPESL